MRIGLAAIFVVWGVSSSLGDEASDADFVKKVSEPKGFSAELYEFERDLYVMMRVGVSKIEYDGVNHSFDLARSVASKMPKPCFDSLDILQSIFLWSNYSFFHTEKAIRSYYASFASNMQACEDEVGSPRTMRVLPSTLLPADMPLMYRIPVGR